MADYDGLDKAFNSKNVMLQIATAATGSTYKDAIMAYDITTKKSVRTNTVETKGGVGFFFGARIIGVTFETIIVKDVMTILNTANTPVAYKLPIHNMKVLATALDASTITETLKAYVTDIESFAITDTLYYWAKVTLMIPPANYAFS